MKYITELLVVLLSAFCTLNEAQYIEMPSDMLYPCQMGGYYGLPIDESYIPDIRLKRQQKLSIGQRIESLRKVCATDLGIPGEEIPEDLLNTENPSQKIKCLMTCILQRLQLMTEDNLMSIRGIEQVADDFGNYNPLITAVAVALAQQFNERLSTTKITDRCEAGYLINEYIAKEIKQRKVNISK